MLGIISFLFTAMLITHVQLRKGYNGPENTVDECCSIVLSLLFNHYLASVVHERMSMEQWRNDEVGISKYSREQPVPGTIFPLLPQKTRMVCPVVGPGLRNDWPMTCCLS